MGWLGKLRQWFSCGHAIAVAEREWAQVGWAPEPQLSVNKAHGFQDCSPCGEGTAGSTQ